MRAAVGALSCFLLATSALVGQPIVGDELVTNAIGPRDDLAGFAAPALALARDARGTAIAWSARDSTSNRDNIYVARLNENGGIIGAVRQVPTFSPPQTVEPSTPSMAAAPSGVGFVLAWAEVNTLLPSNPARFDVYCLLDSELRPARPQLLLKDDPAPSNDPVIVRSLKSTWITTSGLVWQVSLDGSVGSPTQTGVTANDLVLANESLLFVGTQSVPSDKFTSCTPSCLGASPWECPPECRVYVYAPLLKLVWLNTISLQTSLLSFSAQPVLSSDGRSVLVVWFDGDLASGGLIVAFHADLADFGQILQHEVILGTFAGTPGETRPDIATDGQRYVIVWRTPTSRGDYDVVGAVLDSAGKLTTFTIASSPADERDPSVLAVREGRFLVAYEKIINGERHLAGRFVDFPTRRRVVQ